MSRIEEAEIESRALGDFREVMAEADSPQVHMDSSGQGSAALVGQPGRLNLDPDSVKNGLGQLVLTLVKLIHELLERQALRRIDSGSLSDNEIERLGVTLMKQTQEIDRLRMEFGLEEEDLNLDLGPLGKLL